MRRSLLLLLVLAPFAAGCSADAVPRQEPTLTTAGAFFAIKSPAGRYALSRTLFVQPTDDEDLLLYTVYKPQSASLAAARELAKERSIPIKYPVLAAPLSEFDDTGVQVVWFRTLTAEETDGIF